MICFASHDYCRVHQNADSNKIFLLKLTVWIFGGKDLQERNPPGISGAIFEGLSVKSRV